MIVFSSPQPPPKEGEPLRKGSVLIYIFLFFVFLGSLPFGEGRGGDYFFKNKASLINFNLFNTLTLNGCLGGSLGFSVGS
jgi:hypothetical protein